MVKVSKNDNVYGITWGNVVREYLKTAYSEGDEQADIISDGVAYKVLKREKVTVFYDADGNTLFDVENGRLEKEYGYVMKEDGTVSKSEECTDADRDEGKTADLEKEVADKEEGENQDGGAAPARCITGKSKSGICGAAAYCAKGLECCSACSNPCNIRCGWLDVQEESSAYETPAVTDKPEEDFKGKAKEKLHEELEKEDDKQFAEPIIEYLLKRCGDDNGLAQDVMQEHKTWKKCMKYIFDQARKQAKGNQAAVRYDVVYEWAEDYYHKDDKAEEDRKAKEAAERKKKEEERKKTCMKAAEKKATDKKNIKQGAKKEDKAEEKPAEQQKSKKAPKEIDGQMDLFSMMGM